MAKKSWEITLWAEAEHAGEHAFEGEYADAVVAAKALARRFESETERATTYYVTPTGLELESLPRGWSVDEENGWLVAAKTIADPLPQVAVRVFKGGGVVTVLERGLVDSPAVMAAIGKIVPKHLGSERSVSIDRVVACQAELSDILARLAARAYVRVVTCDDVDDVDGALAANERRWERRWERC
jgi:hypothetical protein